ncbi:MAG: threonine--tRNA ligase [Lachnospiraceae bacterium]|nr:threonine--tRNA ligase [Lachnospiraceae bacterium]
MKIELKDGTVREYDKELSALEIAREISKNLAKKAYACKVDQEVCDIRTNISKDCKLEILTFEEEEGRAAYRHTASHILAQAIKRLYPDTKLAIGPSIKDGFYYDFEFAKPFTENDLAGVEREMKHIIKEDEKLVRYTLPKKEAIKKMQERNEPYKVELIEALPEREEISFYDQGEYVDLCAGPHVESTGRIKAVKLMSVAGAYWHGDEKNKMLTRIYGTAFETEDALEAHLAMLKEAEARDHRKLGKELGIFAVMDEGAGFPFFLPNGMVLKNLLIDYWRKLHQRENYLEISTPMILTRKLWETSGHWDHYRQNMYTTVIDDEDFAIKPMNCPGGMLVYKSQMHSYKELPLRIGELGLVHRHEKSGTLHGLMRVRCFTQDDAHIFMMESQMTEEIKGVVRLIDEVYKKFGFTYHVELSTRPEDSIGSDEDWEAATNALEEALKEMNLDYVINEGDGAFYGPKIDFHLQDSIGRTWQCGTIQLDFQLPLRFEAEYIGADGKAHRPIMIHRVIFGSIERFIGILIEHYAGKFPFWLSPVQVKILPISDKFTGYAKEVEAELKSKGVRAEVDIRDEKIGYKIRGAQMQKVPYMFVVGAKEEENHTVAVRERDQTDSKEMTVEDFLKMV